MPAAIVAVITLQSLLCATFLILPITVWRTGTAAQRAAETEIVRQGHAPTVLDAHGIRFEEKGWEFVLALAIAAILAGLVGFELGASPAARVTAWVVSTLVLLGVGAVTASQVFARRYTEAAFRGSADPAVRTIDARALLAAASSGFPRWVRAMVLFRFVLATFGSLAVIIALATPAASAYF
ncbi:hypothetical protein HLB23_35060 [Nocardia uniformis]|uniref:Uncharacterized protein n=1 Tax=Nocardia uniformis TaxID=53432 RepID=A0A849C897_9NOCA|nr:hypothetical protein [Nocardia uniformis]NNH75013.1 hypothetical protein [Nocardia uniformis]